MPTNCILVKIRWKVTYIDFSKVIIYQNHYNLFNILYNILLIALSEYSPEDQLFIKKIKNLN